MMSVHNMLCREPQYCAANLCFADAVQWKCETHEGEEWIKYSLEVMQVPFLREHQSLLVSLVGQREHGMYVALGGRDVMEESNQLLTNQVLMKEREVLNGMEDDGIGEDGGIEWMGSKGG